MSFEIKYGKQKSVEILEKYGLKRELRGEIIYTTIYATNSTWVNLLEKYAQRCPASTASMI